MADLPRIALAMAGGNALGAYEAGACSVLLQRGVVPDIISGGSIGAINGAIFAGNAPEQRVAKFTEFWTQASAGSAPGWAPASGRARQVYNSAHAAQTLLFGRPGLFSRRLPGAISLLPGVPPDVAIFDQRVAVGTLERIIDFDRLNNGPIALIVNTVDIVTGDIVRFDSRRQRIEPVHLVASAGLMPAFPPIEVDGRWLGDPGLASNLSLDALLEPSLADDLLCFAIDLFDARGAVRPSLDGVIERAQDILLGTQSLRTIEARGREQHLRHLVHLLAARVRETEGDRMPIDIPRSSMSAGELTLVLIAYRARQHELASKTLEFSRASIDDRWSAGVNDMRAALDRFDAGDATRRELGFTFFDCRQPSSTREG